MAMQDKEFTREVIYESAYECMAVAATRTAELESSAFSRMGITCVARAAP